MINMKRISVKIGYYFLISSLLVESFLFLLLYFSLVNSRVNEEVDALLARGNSHRDVLEKSFNPETISHVALMESEAKTKVVITSKTGDILAASKNVDSPMKRHLKNNMPVSPKGIIIEKHWRTSNYICTVSPIIIDHQIKGYVYMFLGTDTIKSLVNHMKNQFLIAGVITFLITVITMFLLSKVLTIPLIRMKEATKKLSTGDLSVSLNIKSKDEIGELASSIQQLANDLDYFKKERNNFLASVAHELRTPLTYVKGYAEIALRDNLSYGDRQKYLLIIKEEAEHLTRLVQNLFELAQLEQHTFKIEKEKTNLCDFLTKVITKIEPAYLDKNLKIMLSCPSNVTVHIDQQRFEQVLVNLLNNAYRHSPNNSIIRVNVDFDPNTIKMMIKDEGEGIPSEDLPHIFERFYRVDKSRTRATGGSGLGLAIVKEIVELHGGQITIKSKLNQGTTVIIHLPSHNPNV